MKNEKPSIHFPVFIKNEDTVYFRVDEEDYDRLDPENWHLVNNIPVRSILMREAITGKPSNHKEKNDRFHTRCNGCGWS